MPLVVRGTSFPPSADLPAMLQHAMDMYNPQVGAARLSMRNYIDLITHGYPAAPAQIVANVTAWVMQNYPPYPFNDK